MNEDTQKLYTDYAQLKQMIADLEKRRTEIELALIEAWEGDRPVETVLGTFSLMSKKAYEYSNEVVQLKEQLYKVKKQEEANGTAVLKTHSQYVRFDPKK